MAISMEDDVMFRQAHADINGYGVTWNDDIDLAESEIWINGKETEQGSVPDANTRR
jgi:hypothetical protein